MANVIAPRNRIIRPRGYGKPAQVFLDQAHPLSRGIVGCWPMGDVRIGRTQDVGPFSRHANVSGTAASTLSPSHHGGLAFNTNSNAAYCVAPGFPSLTYPLSLSVWANFTTSPSNGTHYVPFGLADNVNSNSNFFYFEISGLLTGSTVSVRAEHSGTNRWFDTTAPAPTANAWHHYVALYQDSSNFALYIDGVIQAGGYSHTGAPVPTNVNSASIGALNYNGGSLYGNFAGAVDMARVYNRVLSAPEIQQLFSEPYAGLYAMPADLGGAPPSVKTGTAVMGFSGISFNATGTDSHTGTANLALQGISFGGAGSVTHVKGTGNIALGGISIQGGGFNAGQPGQGLRQFWTC